MSTDDGRLRLRYANGNTPIGEDYTLIDVISPMRIISARMIPVIKSMWGQFMQDGTAQI